MKDPRTAEIELMDLKWFDYRALPPDLATMGACQKPIWQRKTSGKHSVKRREFFGKCVFMLGAGKFRSSLVLNVLITGS